MGILRQNSGDITQGVIWKQLLAFFFPLWFGTFFQQLYNTVDTVVVGRFVGKTALAAVGSTGVVVNLTVGVFTGACQRRGGHHRPALRRPAGARSAFGASIPPCSSPCCWAPFLWRRLPADALVPPGHGDH